MLLQTRDGWCNAVCAGTQRGVGGKMARAFKFEAPYTALDR